MGTGFAHPNMNGNPAAKEDKSIMAGTNKVPIGSI